MFTVAEKKLVEAALVREIAAIERFVRKSVGAMKEAAEVDMVNVGKVLDKVRASKGL